MLSPPITLEQQTRWAYSTNLSAICGQKIRKVKGKTGANTFTSQDSRLGLQTFILQHRDEQVDDGGSKRLYAVHARHRVVGEVRNCRNKAQFLCHTRQLSLRT